MPNKRTDITETLLREMYVAKRMTYTQIASELTTSVSVIGKYIHAYGIPIRANKDRLVNGISDKRLAADKRHSEFMRGRQHSLGVTHSQETRDKMSKAHKRSYIPEKDVLDYNNFKTKEQTSLLHWARMVKSIKGKQCEACGAGRKLCVHHKNAIITHKEQSFSLSNGAVLCSSCHAKHHNWLHIEKASTATELLFQEWLNV